MKKEIRSILKIRAASMAAEPVRKRDSSSIIEIIEFKLAGENYGIESAYVKEVDSLKDLTYLPGLPSFILGIVNIRGQILAVIDLKKLFNLADKGLGELNKLIILQDEDMEFGILADEVIGTKVIYGEEVLPVPNAINGIAEKNIKGVTKDRLILLSARNLLSDKSIVVNEEVTP
jgi:purine-binding chemotaxis protein CheW